MERDPDWRPWRDAAYSERLFREQRAADGADDCVWRGSYDLRGMGDEDIDREIKEAQAQGDDMPWLDALVDERTRRDLS